MQAEINLQFERINPHFERIDAQFERTNQKNDAILKLVADHDQRLAKLEGNRS